MKYVLLPSGDVYKMTDKDYRSYLEYIRSSGDSSVYKKFKASYFATPTNVLHLTREEARAALIQLNKE